MDDAGPTSEHNGIAAFWQIELNPPKPIIVAQSEWIRLRAYGVNEVGRQKPIVYIGIRLVSTTTDEDLSAILVSGPLDSARTQSTKNVTTVARLDRTKPS